MRLPKKNIAARYILFLLVSIMISINAFCGSSVSRDTSNYKLGQHLRDEGFSPAFSVGLGATSMISYNTYGISGRAYLPIPFGFRIVTNYTNFKPNNDWRKESHLNASLQYPLFSHKWINLYASIGANCIESKILKDYISTYSNRKINKGINYYFNPVLGLGTEVRLHKIISIYHEWNMVNEDSFYASLGLKVNLLTLKNKRGLKS